MKVYMLDDEHRPVEAELMEWARWYGTADRIVAQTETELFWVSTVFLGIDHRWGGNGPPMLFETMVFQRERVIIELFGRLASVRPDVEMMRHVSWDDAETGHKATVSRLRKQEAAVKSKLGVKP